MLLDWLSIGLYNASSLRIHRVYKSKNLFEAVQHHLTYASYKDGDCLKAWFGKDKNSAINWHNFHENEMFWGNDAYGWKIGKLNPLIMIIR